MVEELCHCAYQDWKSHLLAQNNIFLPLFLTAMWRRSEWIQYSHCVVLKFALSKVPDKYHLSISSRSINRSSYSYFYLWWLYRKGHQHEKKRKTSTATTYTFDNLCENHNCLRDKSVQSWLLIIVNIIADFIKTPTAAFIHHPYDSGKIALNGCNIGCQDAQLWLSQLCFS